MSSYGKSIFKNVESVKEKDILTIELKLTKPTGITLVSLAMPNGGAFIYYSGNSPPVRVGMRAVSCIFRSYFDIIKK
jgi:hypothetical protein